MKIIHFRCNSSCPASVLDAIYLPDSLSDSGLLAAPDDNRVGVIEKPKRTTDSEEGDRSGLDSAPMVSIPKQQDEELEPIVKETYADTVKLPPKTDGQPRSDVGKSRLRLSGRVTSASGEDMSSVSCAIASFGKNRPRPSKEMGYSGKDRSLNQRHHKYVYISF